MSPFGGSQADDFLLAVITGGDDSGHFRELHDESVFLMGTRKRRLTVMIRAVQRRENQSRGEREGKRFGTYLGNEVEGWEATEHRMLCVDNGLTSKRRVS